MDIEDRVVRKNVLAGIVVSIVDNWFGREMTDEDALYLEDRIELAIGNGDSIEDLFSIALSHVDGHGVVPDDSYKSAIAQIQELIDNPKKILDY